MSHADAKRRPADSPSRLLWLQPRGTTDPPGAGPIVHAILHDEQGPARCTAIGRHAFSDDLGKTWTYAREDAYNGSVAWAGGGAALDCAINFLAKFFGKK